MYLYESDFPEFSDRTNQRGNTWITVKWLKIKFYNNMYGPTSSNGF